MSSEAITRNDLKAVLDGVLPTQDVIQEIKTLQGTQSSGNIGTAALHHCTGTISHNQIFFTELMSGLWFVQGRVNINSFVRSSANPGVYIALPSTVPTPTKTQTYIVGFRAQDAREIINLNFTAGSRNAYFTSTESYTNCVNGTLTFIVNGIIAPW